MVGELGKVLRILLSGSEKMICIGVNGWAFFGCMSALSLLLGNEFITTFSIVMFITSSGAALIGCSCGQVRVQQQACCKQVCQRVR